MATTLPKTFQSDSPQFNAAFAYVMQVKDRFVDRPDVFQQFLAIIKTASGDVDRATLEARVAELFAGHADLVDGFKVFSQPSPQAAL